MVLELTVPHAPDVEALLPLWPVFLSYVLSFINLGIYWNNHHHLLQAARVVDGRVLWANMLLLFWLSLFPFGTAWMGENRFAPVPTAVYGVILLLAAISYYLLVRALIASRDQSEALAAVVGRDRKGVLSALIYAAAIPIALVAPYVSFTMFAVVAAIWFVPDRRMERALRR